MREIKDWNWEDKRDFHVKTLQNIFARILKFFFLALQHEKYFFHKNLLFIHSSRFSCLEAQGLPDRMRLFHTSEMNKLEIAIEMSNPSGRREKFGDSVKFRFWTSSCCSLPSCRYILVLALESLYTAPLIVADFSSKHNLSHTKETLYQRLRFINYQLAILSM